MICAHVSQLHQSGLHYLLMRSGVSVTAITHNCDVINIVTTLTSLGSECNRPHWLLISARKPRNPKRSVPKKNPPEAMRVFLFGTYLFRRRLYAHRPKHSALPQSKRYAITLSQFCIPNHNHNRWLRPLMHCNIAISLLKMSSRSPSELLLLTAGTGGISDSKLADRRGSVEL